MVAAAAVGTALAVSALLVHGRTRRTERDNPPTGRFVRADGVHLHYVERGRGQPLVLLHGNGSQGDEFDIAGLLDAASKQYRVIVFDRPGFGHSERPLDRTWTPEAQAALLHKALRLIGVDNAIVFGHSWGAQVGLAMALNHPGMVKSLVLASGYYYATPRIDVLPMSLPAVPLLGTLLRYTVTPWLGALSWPLTLRKLFRPSAIAPTFARQFPMWMTLRPSQLRASAAEAALMIPAAIGLRSRYAELQMPVVLIAGDGDRVVSAQRQTVRLHDALPLSEMRLVPGAGHMFHHVHPFEAMLAIDRAAQAHEVGKITGVAAFGSQSKVERTRQATASPAADYSDAAHDKTFYSTSP